MKHPKLLSLILALTLALSLAAPALAAESAPTFPEKFDLRDENLVSSVKLQNPWGTCWGFGTTAAAEISILAELRKISPEYAERYADPDSLDLSEMQLTWFALNRIPVDSEDSQAGEGRWVEDTYSLNAGGSALLGSSVYSSGIGPLLEEEVPYRNHEGVMMVDSRGRTTYADKHEDDPSVYYDWSVDERYRYAYMFELEESCILPDPAQADEEGNYVYHPEATLAIKEQLMQKRGVVVSFCADTFRPNDPSESAPKYINTSDNKWAHYTWSEDGSMVSSNHAVCVVGWDDTYSKDNFLADHQPPADGAWIVKNSWGAITNEVPHKADYGVDGSGYFYLSYYDMSLDGPESFNFDVPAYVNNEMQCMYVEQYDRMPAGARIDIASESVGKVANVFTAETDIVARTVGVQTCSQDLTVTVELYLLNEGSETPEDGELLSTVEKTFHYAGYHRLALPKPVTLLDGSRHAVVVTMKNPDGAYCLPLSINIAAMPGMMGGTLHCTAVVNEGESYSFDEEDGWNDWSETLPAILTIMGGDDSETEFVGDNHTIKVFADPFTNPTDIPANSWYAEAVSNALTHGLMQTSQKQFRPDEAVDRDAMELAVASMLSQDDEVFDGIPAEGALTREQIALILYRCAQNRGKGFTGAWMFLLDYKDAAQISEAADEAMHWMVMNQVIQGDSGRLMPGAVATRAQLAAMLLRFTNALSNT